jgi:hypothetical protein
MFSLTVWAVARNTAQHEDIEVVRVDGSGAIKYPAGIVVVIERLPHVVNIVIEGLPWALSDHLVVQQGQGASKGTTVDAFTHDVPRGSGADKTCWGDAFHRLVSALICACCMK